MEFYGGVWGGKREKWLSFGGNPNHDIWLWRRFAHTFPSIIVVECPCCTIRLAALLVHNHRQYRLTLSCNKQFLAYQFKAYNVVLFLLANSYHYSLHLQV